jgi:hypothetical protein
MAAATPLATKLGIREGDRVGLHGAPDGFLALLGTLPAGTATVRSPRRPCAVQVVFAARMSDLEPRFARAVGLLPADGGLWVAYPKRDSGVATDLDFATVQETGLGAGLVDNKVAGVDGTWTALRFVVRRVDRAAWHPGGAP